MALVRLSEVDVLLPATKAAPKVNPELEAPIKALIEEETPFGYRSVARLLGMNWNMGSGSSRFEAGGFESAIGHRPRNETLPSVAQAPDER